MCPRIRRCFICKRTQTEDEYVTLHSFPKDVQTNLRWKQICNLQKTDISSGLTICSLHFTKESYVNPAAAEYGGKLRLKAGSYPSIIDPLAAFGESTADIKNILETTEEVKHESPPSRTSSPTLDEPTTCTPKKRKFFSPRYLGDISSVDHLSPKRAKESVRLAKQAIQKKNLQIRALKAKNRRLEKKIVSMQGMLGHLTRKVLKMRTSKCEGNHC